MISIPLKQLGDCYAFCDPAHKKKEAVLKRQTARSAIVVGAQDALSRVFVLSAWAKRCGVDELTDRIFETAEEFHKLTGRPIKAFGIEANAMQSLFAGSVRREARFREVQVTFLPVEQPTNVQKEWRIREALQPVVANGRLFVRHVDVELRQEITHFPSGRTVDLIDALASFVRMLPKRTVSQIHKDEYAALAAYLRRSGIPAAQIELRLEELVERQLQTQAPLTSSPHDPSRGIRMGVGR